MPSREDIVYKSKVDTWLGLVLLLVAAMGPVSLAVGVNFLTNCARVEAWIFIGSGVFLIAVMSLLVWPVTYTLTIDKLVIRSGVFRSRLSYDTIQAVYPSRNPLSSPALSLDRMRIDHTGKLGFTLISPENSGRFLQDLAERAPHLRLAGARLQGK